MKAASTSPHDKLTRRISFRISPALLEELRDVAAYLAMHHGKPVSVSWVIMKMIYGNKEQFYQDFIDGKKDLEE